jgi:hypothetical protein
VILAALGVFVLAIAARWVRDRRIWLAAFVEQVRREKNHHIEYRHDQTVHAIQQRLSRRWGKRRGFSKKTRERILKELPRHALD